MSIEDQDWKPIHTRACEIVFELEAIQKKYGITEEQLYDAASDDSRKEYFIKMFKLLQEYTA